MKSVAAFALLLVCPLAAAQSTNAAIPVGVRFSALEANAPPGTCGCFWLKGGAADASVRVFGPFSTAIDVSGETVNKVSGTSQGLSEITLMAGPRYTLPFRRLSLNGQALFGAAHGFNSGFATGNTHSSTSTAFGMSLGGFAEFSITRNISLRVVQADYLQTNLPNGADNRQRNLRVGAGVTFRIRVPSR